MIVTRSQDLYRRLRLLRNHGLSNRDEVVMFGHNSRLDSLQAVVANRLIDQAHAITEHRIANAERIDRGLADLGEYLIIPPRRPNVKQVFHTYVLRATHRDRLLDYLIANGIEAKVHYPIPLHLQQASGCLGYKRGDFPVCEEHCNTIITLPVHQHLTSPQVDYMIGHVRKFYLEPGCGR